MNYVWADKRVALQGSIPKMFIVIVLFVIVSHFQAGYIISFMGLLYFLV